MTNSEQFKKDRELLQNAYNDFLSICTRAAVENSRTGTEAAIAFERVKNYSDKLLAAQERLFKEEYRKKLQKLIDCDDDCIKGYQCFCDHHKLKKEINQIINHG